ncbi:MAG: hypothetical protein ACR2IH_01965 [Pyrinomonadaceae bacterium]
MLSSQESIPARTDALFSGSAAAVSTKADEQDSANHTLAYFPRHIVGGSPHPGVIVETPGLANVEKSKDFSGAEIEGAVTDGVLEAFIDGDRPAETKDILKAADGLTPTAQMMSEKIEEIRKWARNNIKGANTSFGDASSLAGPKSGRAYEL